MRFAATLAGLAFALAASAQEPGTIRGDVRDQEWKPLADANVLLEPAVAGSARTSEDGSFVLSGIPPGRYEVVVVKEGFLPWADLDVQVGAAGTIVLHAVMDRGHTGSITFVDEATPDELARYDGDLAIFQDPPLCSPDRARPGFEGYRFVWMRTFHHPVLIDLRFQPDGEIEVIYKECEGASGYEYGKLSRTKVRSVSKDFYKEHEALADDLLWYLREESFAPLWDLPYAIENGLIGLDGATWTIEGVRDSRCHVVTRWAPSEQDPVRFMGLRLLNLTKQRIDPGEIY